MVKNDDFTPTSQNMLFDLRQTYAMQIITPILIELEYHRGECNFMKWFETLTDKLYVNVYQKINDDERKEYKQKLSETVKVINANTSVFKGINKDELKKYYVKEALKELELWLKAKMEDKGLYGKGSEYDWDEI